MMCKKLFDEVLEDKTKFGTKIKTEDYLEEGVHMIIDQGQAQVAGYTNLEEGLFVDVPAIVFGDHTRVIKYVEEPFFLGADGVKVLKSKFANANHKYLYYALKNVKIPNTGYNRHFKWLKGVQIFYPDTRVQNDVVKILDKVSSIVDARRRELQKLDELIKSRFVEMFIGKGYPIRTINEVSLGKGEYGAQSASTEYDPKRPRYVRITDINDDGTLNDDMVASINSDDDEQYRLEYGDFMFARMGATVGKTYTFISGNQIFAGYLIRYKLNHKLINPRYLFWYTKLDEYWNWVKLNQSGAAQPGINAQKYGALQIPVPPIELQEQFAAFVEQIDKSKVVVQKSLDETQLLFDSLMQKYFG